MKHSLRLFFEEENLLRCLTRISSDETLKYGIRFPALLQSRQTSLSWLFYIIKIKFIIVEF